MPLPHHLYPPTDRRLRRAGHPASPPPPQPQLPNYMGLQLAHDASSTLYIEGLPADASEREVSHIFRRYEGAGFQSIRMRPIESAKNPGTNLFLCFAEFDNAHQATIAMHGLQGYRFDLKVDGAPGGLRISFAKSKGAPRSGGGAPPPRAALPPPPQQQLSYDRGYGNEGGYAPPPDRRDDRREDRGGGRDDRYDGERDGRGGGHNGGSYDDDRYDDRRRGHEHSDRYRDDYEESERGDDDLFRSADNVSMAGITD